MQGLVKKRYHTVSQSGISVTYFASKRPFLLSLIQLKPNTLWTAMCHLNLKRCEPVTWLVGGVTPNSMPLQSFARFVLIFILRASLMSLHIGPLKLLDVATLAVEVQVHQTR